MMTLPPPVPGFESFQWIHESIQITSPWVGRSPRCVVLPNDDVLVTWHDKRGSAKDSLIGRVISGAFQGAPWQSPSLVHASGEFYESKGPSLLLLSDGRVAAQLGYTTWVIRAGVEGSEAPLPGAILHPDSTAAYFYAIDQRTKTTTIQRAAGRDAGDERQTIGTFSTPEGWGLKATVLGTGDLMMVSYLNPHPPPGQPRIPPRQPRITLRVARKEGGIETGDSIDEWASYAHLYLVPRPGGAWLGRGVGGLRTIVHAVDFNGRFVGEPYEYQGVGTRTLSLAAFDRWRDGFLLAVGCEGGIAVSVSDGTHTTYANKVLVPDGPWNQFAGVSASADGCKVAFIRTAMNGAILLAVGRLEPGAAVADPPVFLPRSPPFI